MGNSLTSDSLRGELRMATTALKRGWNVSQEMKDKMVQQVTEALDSTNPRVQQAAWRAALIMEQHNITLDLHQEHQPSQVTVTFIKPVEITENMIETTECKAIPDKLLLIDDNPVIS